MYNLSLESQSHEKTKSSITIAEAEMSIMATILIINGRSYFVLVFLIIVFVKLFIAYLYSHDFSQNII